MVAITSTQLQVLAAELGLGPVPFERLPAGRVNEHWRVVREGAPLVLRRYAAGQSGNGIEWEHALLAHARSRGWPVAVPVAVRAKTAIAVDGGWFALFPWAPGEPAAGSGAAQLRLEGRLLARFHSDMAGFPLGQRPDLGRAWELDTLAARAGGMTFNQLLARFTTEYPEVGRALRSARYRNLRELARLGYGELPDVVAQCDFHRGNLLFSGGELTGLLDFDWAHWDAAAYDIAVSLSLDCLAPPVYDHLAPEAAAAFVAGYCEQRPLGEEDVALLPALVRSAWLWLAAFRLVQWHNGWLPGERAAASLARTAQRRFPGLDAVGVALTAALQRAASDRRS